MPLKRTPPKKAMEPNYDSEPDTQPTTVSEAKVNKTQRLKRKHQQIDDVSVFMTEMKQMLKDFTDQQNLKYNALLTSVTEIKEQYNEIRNTLQFVSAKYDEIKVQFNKLETENITKVAYMQALEEKIENLESYNKSSCLEIRNIPENKEENKLTLSHIIIEAGKALDIVIQKPEIRDIYRLKPKVRSNNNGSTVVVDLTTVIKKDSVLQAYKTYNKNRKDKMLSTTDLKIDGPSKSIFMSEHLTMKKKRLFFLARDYIKTREDIRYCWTSYGKIYIRRQEGQPAIKIDTEADLNKIKNTA